MEEIQIEEKKHIIDVDNKRVAIELEDRTWRSGCLTIDRKAVVFFSEIYL